MASDILQWSEFGKINVTMRKVDVEMDLEYSLSHMKMDELKPISHKEFNEFIKGRGFRGRNDYALKDLKAKFGLKPLVERRVLVVSSEDIEPTTFDSMRKVAKAIGMSKGAIRYVKNNGKDCMRRFKGGSIRCFS